MCKDSKLQAVPLAPSKNDEEAREHTKYPQFLLNLKRTKKDNTKLRAIIAFSDD